MQRIPKLQIKIQKPNEIQMAGVTSTVEMTELS